VQELYDRGSALVNTRMRAVYFHVRILGAENSVFVTRAGCADMMLKIWIKEVNHMDAVSVVIRPEFTDKPCRHFSFAQCRPQHLAHPSPRRNYRRPDQNLPAGHWARVNLARAACDGGEVTIADTDRCCAAASRRRGEELVEAWS